MLFEIAQESVSKYGHVLYGDGCVVNWAGAGWYAPKSGFGSDGTQWTEYYLVGNQPDSVPDTYTLGLGTPTWYDGFTVVTA